MLGQLLRALVAAVVRPVAVVVGLLVAIGIHLAGDAQAPLGAQIGLAISKLRALAHALDSLG